MSRSCHASPQHTWPDEGRKGPLGYGECARLLRAPSALEVSDALDELGRRVRSDATFVLYFSGHGWQNEGGQVLPMPRVNLGKPKAGDMRDNDGLSRESLLADVAGRPGRVQGLFLLGRLPAAAGPTGRAASTSGACVPTWRPCRPIWPVATPGWTWGRRMRATTPKAWTAPPRAPEPAPKIQGTRCSY